MAEAALQKISPRAQLLQGQGTARRDQRPISQSRGSVLPSKRRKQSRTQHNLKRVDNTGLLSLNQPNVSLPSSRIRKVRDSFAGAMAVQDAESKIRHQLELDNKARLAQDRQRIRSEMASYKLPNMQVAGYEEPEELEAMQAAYGDEYQKQVQTPEFLKAAEEKVQGVYGKMDARMRQNRIKRHQKRAAKAAQSAAQQAQMAIKTTSSAGKIGWDTENVISLIDAADPVDLEIPTIFTIIVQMYRACTALLNNGEKFIKGYISFIEPTPLFRFWHPKDIERAAKESMDNPILGGGTELENTIESITLGWPEALLGWWLVGVTLMMIFVTFASLFVVIILILATIAAVTPGV